MLSFCDRRVRPVCRAELMSPRVGMYNGPLTLCKSPGRDRGTEGTKCAYAAEWLGQQPVITMTRVAVMFVIYNI